MQTAKDSVNAEHVQLENIILTLGKAGKMLADNVPLEDMVALQLPARSVLGHVLWGNTVHVVRLCQPQTIVGVLTNIALVGARTQRQ